LPKAIAGKGLKRNLKDLHRARPWTRLLRNSKQRVRPDEVPAFIREADRPFARSLLQAIFDYVPEPFHGTNLLIRCSDPDRRFTFLDADGLLGWRGLLTGTSHHACVEGTHMQMMREPRVGDVQAILGTAITSFLSSGNMKLEAEPVGDRARRSRPNRSARAATV
jgi:thioesterase domain-containing protein